MEECEAGFSFNKELCRKGNGVSVGTMYLRDDLVCDQCEETPNEMEVEQHSDAIAFPSNPDGVGERMREGSEAEGISGMTNTSLPEVLEYPPAVSNYSARIG